MILHRDFGADYAIVSAGIQIMHFAYWAYTVVMVNTVLQAVSCVVYRVRVTVQAQNDTRTQAAKADASGIRECKHRIVKA